MTDIGGMVETLIAAGTPPALAAQIVTQAFAAGVVSANSTGIPVDRVAEKRRAYDRERKRNSTGIPPESTGIPKLANNIDSKKDKISRGTRLPPEWKPDETDRAFARQLGWSETQIDSEGANFRDYWIARPGSGGVKLDWSATWRNWLRQSKIKPAGNALTVVAGSDLMDPEEALKQFLKVGKWSRWAGPEPGMSGCRVPGELFAKYGLSPDGRKIASQGQT